MVICGYLYEREWLVEIRERYTYRNHLGISVMGLTSIDLGVADIGVAVVRLLDRILVWEVYIINQINHRVLEGFLT